MNEFFIRLSSVAEVEAFAAIATSFPFPVFASDSRQSINGKSFMQMFCLRLTEPLQITAECSEELFDQFRQEVFSLLGT